MQDFKKKLTKLKHKQQQCNSRHSKCKQRWYNSNSRHRLRDSSYNSLKIKKVLRINRSCKCNKSNKYLRQSSNNKWPRLRLWRGMQVVSPMLTQVEDKLLHNKCILKCSSSSRWWVCNNSQWWGRWATNSQWCSSSLWWVRWATNSQWCSSSLWWVRWATNSQWCNNNLWWACSSQWCSSIPGRCSNSNQWCNSQWWANSKWWVNSQWCSSSILVNNNSIQDNSSNSSLNFNNTQDRRINLDEKNEFR